LAPCLRSFANHPDPAIQAKAATALNDLRPSAAQVERQLKSEDGRVRASALEGIWRSKTPESAAIFRAALSDKHQRVVANALLGLHTLVINPGST
jgi:HEAT repeat protein